MLLSGVATAASRFVAYDDGRGVLTALADILPAELRTGDGATTWSTWATRHDREIRARLQAGYQETIVNWLLFGTTFTSKPRVALEEFGDTSGKPRQLTDAQMADLIGDRTADLVSALANPGQDDRRLFARDLFRREGYALTTSANRLRLMQHLLALVTRIAAERAKYASDTAAIRRLDDTRTVCGSDRSSFATGASPRIRRSARTSPSKSPWRR